MPVGAPKILTHTMSVQMTKQCNKDAVRAMEITGESKSSYMRDAIQEKNRSVLAKVEA